MGCIRYTPKDKFDSDDKGLCNPLVNDVSSCENKENSAIVPSITFGMA